MQNDPISSARPAPLLNLYRVALPVCVLLTLWGVLSPDSFSQGVQGLLDFTFDAIDWFYMATVTGFVGVALYLAFSSYGEIKLGDSEPDFSTLSWLAMLFSAGMGVGLLFWGVAEPMMHFASPPVGEGGDPAAARQAMVITNFHWGLHAWAVYGIGALVLAYFGFRRGSAYLPGAPIREVFNGAWVKPVAFAADLIAVVAVTFGVAGSVAMGILQLQAGLHVTAGLPADSTAVAIGIWAVLVVSYMASASTSLDKGIKWLSNINMIVALALMTFILLAGPTAFLLRAFVGALGDYLSSIVALSLRLYPFENITGWTHGWTITYFIWWIAWAPFVGIFIARISRGRTIREFVLGVLCVPTVFSILWFAIFGGTGMYEDMFGAGGVGALVREDVTKALFSLFGRLPLSALLSAVAVVLVFVFLVTSVDSATFVLGMLTSDGDQDPPTSRKIAWGVILGVLGAVLMFSGNVSVIRSAAVSGAIPFTFILLIQTVALIRALRADHRQEDAS